jgi:hypothetical protein
MAHYIGGMPWCALASPLPQLSAAPRRSSLGPKVDREVAAGRTNMTLAAPLASSQAALPQLLGMHLLRQKERVLHMHGSQSLTTPSDSRSFATPSWLPMKVPQMQHR